MKKILTISLSLLVCLTLVVGCGNKKGKEEENKKQEEQKENSTAEVQGDYKVTDVKITSSGATSIVTGKITNTSDTEKNVHISLYMTDSKVGKLLGIVETDMFEFKSNEEREFELSIVGDYTQADTFEVRAREKETYIEANPDEGFIEEPTEEIVIE